MGEECPSHIDRGKRGRGVPRPYKPRGDSN